MTLKKSELAKQKKASTIEGVDSKGRFTAKNQISVGCGRPLIFKSPEELEKKVCEYFNNCPDTIKIYTQNGEYEKPVPTITGLCFFLGFASKETMYNYKKRDEFEYIMNRARLLIERHYEQLTQSSSPAGPIFVLKNLGWKDKQELEVSGHSITFDSEDKGLM